MATVNIIVPLSNPDPNYIYSNVRYARIDNTVSPIYSYLNNVTSNPLIIPNLPSGQYRVYATPVFSDGRICPEVLAETEPCGGINSLSAIYDESPTPLFIISYSAEDSTPDVRINISYPNGGFSNSIHTNDGNDISIVVPAGVYGTYFITMQPVCDEETGWFGLATAPVTVEIDEPSP